MYKKGRVNSNSRIISTDEDPSLRIESSAIINLRGVSTKLNKYIVFTMQTYKKLIVQISYYNSKYNSASQLVKTSLLSTSLLQFCKRTSLLQLVNNLLQSCQANILSTRCEIFTYIISPA